MLISVHIPKTAGSTFSNVLSLIYSGRIFLDYGDQYAADDVYNLTGNVRLRRLIKKLRHQSRPRITDQCIHGHFLATKYDKFVDVKLITWLRDPIERIASHYYHWKRQPDYAHPVCRYLVKNNLSLEQFAKINTMRDFQSRYLDGKPLDNFWFVGIQEHFDHMLPIFLAELDAPPINVQPARVNLEKPYNKRYDLESSTRRKLENLNVDDRRLYDSAVEQAIQRGWIS